MDVKEKVLVALREFEESEKLVADCKTALIRAETNLKNAEGVASKAIRASGKDKKYLKGTRRYEVGDAGTLIVETMEVEVIG